MLFFGKLEIEHASSADNKPDKRQYLCCAIEHLEKGFQANDAECTQVLKEALLDLCQLDNNTTDTVDTFFKDGFRNGNPSAAIYIDFDKDNAQYPTIEAILWLQFSAQSGSHRALMALKKLDKKNEHPSPYILLCIRYHLCIWHSPF